MIPNDLQDIAIADEYLNRDRKGSAFSLGDIPTYAGAVLADTLITTGNSIGSFAPDEWWEPQSTYDWLTEKGYTDTAEYYKRNQEAVELGSFIGGIAMSAVGGGLVLGALRAGRLGALSANPFSKFIAGAQKNREQMLKLIEEGAANTKAYKGFRNRMATYQLANGVVEGVTYEAAFAAMQHEHKWMENYNPGLFLLGAGAGAIFGGGVRYWQMNREIAQTGKGIQIDQLKAAKAEEHVATEELYAIEDVAEELAQRGRRIASRDSELQSGNAEGVAKQYLEQQAIKDKNYHIGKMTKFLPKGSVPAGTKFEPAVGQKVGADQTYLDPLYRLTVNHPTGIALAGSKKLNWWDTKAVNVDDLIGSHPKTPDDIHGIWNAHQTGGKGPVPKTFQERAVFDPRSGQSSLILGEAAALTNLRAADDPAFNLVANRWNTLPKVGDDLWSEADGIYKLHGTISGDKHAYLSMTATLPPKGSTLSVAGSDIYKLQRLIHEEDLFVNYSVKIDNNTILGADDLLSAYKTGKTNIGQQLQAEGYSQSQIATFLNMSDGDIWKLMNGQWADDTVVDSWGLYTKDKTELNKWLTQKQLVFEGDSAVQQRISNLTPLTRLDAEGQYNQHQSIVNQTFTDTNVGAKPMSLYEEIIDDPGWEDITSNLTNFMSQLGTGTRKFGSADFAMRDFGHFGDFAVSTGARLKDWVNRTVSDTNVGLAPLQRAIQSDRTQSAVWGQMYKAYTGLPGSLTKSARWDPSSGRIILDTQPGGLGTPLKVDGQVLNIDPQSATGKWLSEWTRPGGANETLGDMTDALQRLKGYGNLDDARKATGLYFPYPNLEDKFTAYIHNIDGVQKSKLIVANSEDELGQLIRSAEGTLTPLEQIVRRADTGDWAIVHGYHHEVGRLERFDPSKGKSGIQITGISPTAAGMNDVMQGLHWEVNGRARSLVKNSNPYLMDSLQSIRNFHRRGFASSNQGLAQSIKANQTGKDPGTLFYNTLMNQSGNADFPLMHSANNFFETGLNRALMAVNTVAENTVGKVIGKTPVAADFDEVVQGLARARVPNPWRDVNAYVEANYKPAQNLAPSAVNTFNAIQATLTLRMAELGHAGVTLLSYPISMAAGGLPFKHMMNAVKMQFGTDDFSKLMRARAGQHGFLDPQQYLFEQSNAYAAGMSGGGVQKVLDSPLMKMLTAPSDWSEKATRHLAYFAGISQAAAKDPVMIQRLMNRGMNGGMDLGEHAAHSFTLRTMGNYNGTQRPQLFQGSLGNAMMLYQTYMLTMAQNMFRFMERSEVKHIAKTLLGYQLPTFGMSTLPMYDYLNKMFGEHVVEDRMDITSLVNRVGGDTDTAEFILYGAPSWLTNTAFTSRAELEPRLPLAIANEGVVGVLPPVVSFIKQTYDLGKKAAMEIGGTLNAQGGFTDYLWAADRAFSQQSISRPARGMAELLQGYTLDRNGAVVENPAFFEFTNIMRAVGVRPLKEHVLRQTRYMNRYYDGIDSTNRQKAVNKLREWQVRPDNGLDIGNIAAEYLENGGTSRGWNSSLNRTFLEANVPFANRLQKEVAGQPLLDDIVDGYIY